MFYDQINFKHLALENFMLSVLDTHIYTKTVNIKLIYMLCKIIECEGRLKLLLMAQLL